MGSIEVYHIKQEKWVPYVPDYDKWYQHFKDLSEGYVQPDHMGRCIIGSGRKLKEMEAQQRQKETEIQQQQTPVMKQVTLVAQAIEKAKSEIENVRRKVVKNVRRRSKLFNHYQKQLKHYAYNPEDQV